AQPPRGADALERLGDLVGIDRVRVRALEAQQYGLVGTVTAAGHRQRAVQLGAHTRHAVQHAFLLQPAFGEACRGTHWPHRVRGGRPDADLEQVEYADGHDALRVGRRNRYSTQAPSVWQSIRARMADLT